MSSHVSPFGASRTLTRAAAHYFQVPPSHCVPAMSSHVIAVLLVSLVRAVEPDLFPGAPVALGLDAVIPRHEEPPYLAVAIHPA
jgi:hypothetical protein